jgi:hypothetical protein
MLSCSQSLCKKHNIMKGAAPLHEWLSMLVSVEEHLRNQKEERWQVSVEGKAYHAAHPHAFFPRGWPNNWKVRHRPHWHKDKLTLKMILNGARRGTRGVSAARQRTKRICRRLQPCRSLLHMTLNVA